MGRRDFLKSTAAGLGGFVYLSANEKSSPEKGQEKKEGKITYSLFVFDRAPFDAARNTELSNPVSE
jgi:hypothetical protein